MLMPIEIQRSATFTHRVSRYKLYRPPQAIQLLNPG